MDILFTMNDTNLYSKLIVDVFGQMLSAVDTTVLTACTAEREHKRREAALNVTTHMSVGQPVDALEERENLAIILKETDDGFVKSRKLLVRLITPGVVG